MNNKQSNWIFIVVGIIFVLLSVFVMKNDADIKNTMDSQIKSSYVTHKQTIKRSSKGSRTTMYIPIYHYNVNGSEYTCMAKSSSSHKSSKNTIVYYKSSNPAECHIPTKGMSIFLIVGLIAIAIGIKTTLFPKD